MQLLAIHDKSTIKQYLKNVESGNFIYHCGNLESPFWENVQWFGLFENNKLLSLAMLVIKYGSPVLLSSSYCENDSYQDELLRKLSPFLPKGLYSHLNIGKCSELKEQLGNAQITKYYNMQLQSLSNLDKYDTSKVVDLSEIDTKEIEDLLNESHPDHLLDYEFINEGLFCGIREEGRLVSVAGVCAKTEEFNCIAIGNITTLPRLRRTGMTSITTVALIKRLLKKYDKIALNVKQQNEAAVNCYKKLGFEVIGVFEEAIFE